MLTCKALPQEFNTPPTLWLDRNWKIPSDSIVGSLVARARAGDNDGQNITFSISPGTYLDGSHLFRIDRNTGVIYLNKSIDGLAGEQHYLYVSASDGSLSVKVEVWVEIEPPSGQPHQKSIPNIPDFPPGSRGPGRPPLLPSFPQRVSPFVTPRPRHPLQPAEVLDAENGGNSIEKTTTTIKTTTTTIQPISTTEKNQGADVTMTVIPIVVLILLSPVIGAAVYFLKKKLKERRKHVEETKKESAGGEMAVVGVGENRDPSSASWQRAISNRYESCEPSGDNWNPQEKKWEFPRHHLRIQTILGEGCFGQVWKCEALNIEGHDGLTTVAVKTLKEAAGDKEKKDLLQELEVMKLLEPHPNVVTLRGCCTEKDPVFLIMEYVSKGKLQSYLRESRHVHDYSNLHGSSKHLSSHNLTSFAYQVARGMEFLSSKGIIHRDLAARNVLVGENNVCKVADFGFARDVIGNHVYERKSEGRLPIRWMAPESLYDNIFTHKTDVWSFGVLMWEIVTLGSTPYPGMAAGEVMKKVRDGYRLEKPEHCKREVYNIIFYCWDKEPQERPTFTELVRMLDGLLITEVDYIELDRFPQHFYYNMTGLSGEKL